MQWLCNADKSSHDPRLRLKCVPEDLFYIVLGCLLPVFNFNMGICRAFFGSLYRCLARGARAVLQFYADNVKQSEMIVTAAMRAGFAGGVVVDWPHRYGFSYLVTMEYEQSYKFHVSAYEHAFLLTVQKRRSPTLSSLVDHLQLLHHFQRVKVKMVRCAATMMMIMRAVMKMATEQ